MRKSPLLRGGPNHVFIDLMRPGLPCPLAAGGRISPPPGSPGPGPGPLTAPPPQPPPATASLWTWRPPPLPAHTAPAAYGGVAGVVDSGAAPLAFRVRSLGWSLGNGFGVITEVYHVAEANHVTEVSGLKFRVCTVTELLWIVHHAEEPRLDLIWIPAICPVRREQQAWKVGIQPGGPWPRRLEAEIRIVGHEVVLVAIVELDFPGPILVLRFHYAGEPCAGISWFLGIFEEAFYPSPFSDLRSAGSQAPALIQTTCASQRKALRAFIYQFRSPDLEIWRLRSVGATTLWCGSYSNRHQQGSCREAKLSE